MVLSTRTARRFATSAIISFTAGTIPMSVLADEVTLKSADGTVNLVGEFIDFADDNYVIRTGLGDLRIAAGAFFQPPPRRGVWSGSRVVWRRGSLLRSSRTSDVRSCV